VITSERNSTQYKNHSEILDNLTFKRIGTATTCCQPRGVRFASKKS